MYKVFWIINKWTDSIDGESKTVFLRKQTLGNQTKANHNKVF